MRVGAVSYLNTKPLLYGIERSAIRKDIDLLIDHPGGIADMLLNDDIDMGLVPVAIIAQMGEYHINGNFCIGCNGPVGSVAIFSEQPIEAVKQVLLDYQSRTSVQLARVLLKRYWRVNPKFIDAGKDFQDQIRGDIAGVVIGDRALEQRKSSPFVYDLGEAWKKLTGLPFVFAAWISNKPLDKQFVSAFDEANQAGVDSIETVVTENPYPFFDLHEYFTRYLDYRLDEGKLQALEKFLQYLGAKVNSW